MSKEQIQERIFDLIAARAQTADADKRAAYTDEIRRLQRMIDN